MACKCGDKGYFDKVFPDTEDGGKTWVMKPVTVPCFQCNPGWKYKPKPSEGSK